MRQVGVVFIIVFSSAAWPAVGQHSDRHHRPYYKEFTPPLLSCRRAQGAAYGCILVVALAVGECPGVVVMMVR
jgi:hypothetical protein